MDEAPIKQVMHSHLSCRRHHHVTVALAHPEHTEVRGSPQRDNITDGDVGTSHIVLRDKSHPTCANLPRNRIPVFPINRDVTGMWGQAGDSTQQSGLARPVTPDYSDRSVFAAR